MAKNCKIGEEPVRDTGFFGSLVSVITLSTKAGDVVDEMLGGKETYVPYIETDGKREYFKDVETRDAEFLKRSRQ